MSEERQAILIAEDDAINRKILFKLLSGDYEILEAEDGKQAIEILQRDREHIAAMLLDIVMPVMDGYEVLKYLRDQEIDQLPVVVLTGESDSKSEERTLDLGAWDFVMKPYTPKVLQTRVKNAIARSRMNDNHMSAELFREQRMIQEMERALKHEEFEVYFQPKYYTQMRTPFGAEALVRWNHPEKGVILPGRFIPVLETHGFVKDLDYYMWEKTCQYLRKWMDGGLSPAPVSVNMSRTELTNPDLVKLLTDLTDRYQIPHELLQLELTESAYMDNPGVINQIINQLHEEGFSILMDDFGSGYSSLNTLKDISVDMLKIDMKFLSMDENDIKGRKILASIICMAQWIGIPVITEGVETEEQYRFLQSIDCEYIQGFYFSKPVDAVSYENLIRRNRPRRIEPHAYEESALMIPQNTRDRVYLDETIGAYNMSYMREWFLLDLKEIGNQGIPLAVIYMAIEFKEPGEKTEFLQMLVQFMIKHTRKSDAIAYGGKNDFVVVLAGCSEEISRMKIKSFQEYTDRYWHLAEQAGVTDVYFGFSFTESFHKKQEVLYGMIDAAKAQVAAKVSECHENCC